MNLLPNVPEKMTRRELLFFFKETGLAVSIFVASLVVIGLGASLIHLKLRETPATAQLGGRGIGGWAMGFDAPESSNTIDITLVAL